MFDRSSVRVESLETRRLLSAGDLDESFGNGGVVMIDPQVPVHVSAEAVMWRDRIISLLAPPDAASMRITRVRHDGKLDLSFGGGDGTIEIDAAPFDWRSLLAVQPDGKILVAGLDSVDDRRHAIERQLVVQRLKRDGSPDASFGNGGTARLSLGVYFPGDDEPDRTIFDVEDVVVDREGRIVVVGTYEVEGDEDLLVVRFTADGRLDKTLRGKGHVRVDGGRQERGHAVLPLEDGGLLVTATSAAERVSNSTGDLLLVRLREDGRLHGRFGSKGLELTTRVESGVWGAQHLALDRKGRIYVGTPGTFLPDRPEAPDEINVYRFSARGKQDLKFGRDGRAQVDLPRRARRDGSSFRPGVSGLTVLSNGQIIAAATGDIAAGAAVVRLRADGKADPSFGADGVASLRAVDGPTVATATGAFVQESGKIVVPAGFHGTLRYNADGTRDFGFGRGGRAAVPASHREYDASLNDLELSKDGRMIAVVRGMPRAFSLQGKESTAFRRNYNSLNGAGSVAVAGNRIVMTHGQEAFYWYKPNGAPDQGADPIAHEGPWGNDDTFLEGFFGLPDGSFVAVNEHSFGGFTTVTESVLTRYTRSGGKQQQRVTQNSTGNSVGGERMGDWLAAVAPGPGNTFVLATDEGEDKGDLDLRRLRADLTLDDRAFTIDEADIGPTGVTGLAVQEDGKALVMSGEFGAQVLRRYNTDGTLDATFGQDGALRLALGGAARVAGMELQEDGRIVLGGSTGADDADVLLVRYTGNGRPDKTFGRRGRVTLDLGGDESVSHLRIAPDGSILVGGSTGDRPQGGANKRVRPFLARFDA